MTDTHAVTLVTVTYNSAGVLPGLLDCVPEGTPVVVVDNASTDATVEVASGRPGVIFARQERNLGFGTACNIGARQAVSDFVLFLNPDARINPDTIPRLLEAATRYPERCVFNPRIVDDAGATNLRAPSRFLGRGRGGRAVVPIADTPISVLSGAAVFMRRRHFEEIGGFDESIFLYFEDDDLSLRLLEQGFELHHIHGAVVQHQGGRATPPSPALTRFKNYHWMKSYSYVARKHGKPVSRVPLLALSGFRILTATLTGNAAERDKYRGRVKALLEF